MNDRIEEIRARAAAAMPGPWIWKGNTEVQQIELISRAEGLWTVMSFERWGMRDAQPFFLGDDKFLHSVKDFVVYQVCPDCESKDDPRVYRQDFFEINHPDAQFIAHARQDVETLLAEIDRLNTGITEQIASELPAELDLMLGFEERGNWRPIDDDDDIPGPEDGADGRWG